MQPASYIDPASGAHYPLDVPRWCSDERRPLLVTPQGGISRDDIDRGMRSLWRYRASLPVEIARPISMGEGCTPLVQQAWDNFRPYFKLEWFNPTASFKDRGATVMLSFLRQLGVNAVLEDSSGNGGASVAAYGAAGGMREDPCARLHIARQDRSGSGLWRGHSTGGRRRAKCEAEAIRQSNETFYASHNWQPFFLEGTKSFAYELWEDFNYSAPDNIIMPVGAGSSLLGCYIGFKELLAAEQIKKLPRLFAAQPLHCSPVDASFKEGRDTPVSREVHKTIAEGTAIKRPAAFARDDHGAEGDRRQHCRHPRGRHCQRSEAPGSPGPVRRADLRHCRCSHGRSHKSSGHQRQGTHRCSHYRNGHQKRILDRRAFQRCDLTRALAGKTAQCDRRHGLHDSFAPPIAPCVAPETTQTLPSTQFTTRPRIPPAPSRASAPT